MGDDLFSVPAGRNHDLTAVGTHMVINGRDLGWVVLKLLTPSVTNVYVERISISVQFPYTGHRHIVPSFVVVIGPPEIGRTSVSVLYPKEFPRTVQGHEVLGLFLGVLRCHLGGLVGEEIGVHRGTVYGVDLGISPLIRLGYRCESQSGKQSGHKLSFHAIIFLICFTELQN